MMHNRYTILLVMSSASLVAGFGCGGKGAVSTSSDEGTVSGTVKIRGQVATAGEVVFDPSNYRRPSAAPRRVPISPDGTYKVTTLAGENTVQLALPPNPSPIPSAAEGAEEDNRGTTVEYETIVFDVKKGENTLNIEFPRP